MQRAVLRYIGFLTIIFLFNPLLELYARAEGINFNATYLYTNSNGDTKIKPPARKPAQILIGSISATTLIFPKTFIPICSLQPDRFMSTTNSPPKPAMIEPALGKKPCALLRN